MANILIADPDDKIRQIIREVLVKSGHQIFQVEDDQELLEQIRHQPVQLVIAENELSNRDTGELIREIKLIRSQISVVIMHEMGEDETEIIDAGAFATLNKPFNVQEIQRIVADAIPESLASLTQMQASAQSKRSFNFRRWLWILAGGFLSALIVAGGIKFYNSSRVSPIKFFPVSESTISGIASDGQELWVCDWFNQNIYAHRLDSLLTLAQTIHLNNEHPIALTWDGKNLWSASAWEKKIFKHRRDPTLSIDESFPLPAGISDPAALSIDQDLFWLCDLTNHKIIGMKLKGNEFKIIFSAPSPGQKPIGIAREKNFIWTADAKSGLIYKHDLNQALALVDVFSLPPEMQKEKISAFAFDGQTFWIASESTQKIFTLHPTSLHSIRSQ